MYQNSPEFPRILLCSRSGAMPASKPIDPRDRLIFAMDVAEPAAARELAESLGDAVQFYKLGLEMMMSGGYFELLDWMASRGKKVFADLKFFDVPATVGAAVRQLARRGVSFATVHGNQGIMEAAAKAKGEVKILAVTVLTSLDRGDLDDLGFACDVEQLVLSRARRALAGGLRRRGGLRPGTAGHAPRGGPATAGGHAGHPSGGKPPSGRPEARRHRGAGVPRWRGLYCRRPADPRCG
jgi:hypothetical protein